MLPIEVQIQMEMGRPCHSTPFQGLLLPSLPPFPHSPHPSPCQLHSASSLQWRAISEWLFMGAQPRPGQRQVAPLSVPAMLPFNVASKRFVLHLSYAHSAFPIPKTNPISNAASRYVSLIYSSTEPSPSSVLQLQFQFQFQSWFALRFTQSESRFKRRG